MLLTEKENHAPTDKIGPTALNGLEPVYSHRIARQQHPDYHAGYADALVWWMLENIVRYCGYYSMIMQVAARIYKERRDKNVIPG